MPNDRSAAWAAVVMARSVPGRRRATSQPTSERLVACCQAITRMGTSCRPPTPRVNRITGITGKLDLMPMRTDCKNYESRTYPTGETVRKCNIDLAPEAPWRCPENCVGFAARLADVNWAHGNLLSPPTPPEPPGLGDGAAELLDEAEEIVNAAGPRIMAELGVERDRQKAPWWKRLRKK